MAEWVNTCEDGGVELGSSVLGPSQRAFALNKLAEQEFDVLVIGGLCIILYVITTHALIEVKKNKKIIYSLL